jgi:hypothetical protein
MKNLDEDKKKPGGFQFDYLLAFIAFIFWLRGALMLTLTRSFGPLINVIAAMTADMATFFFIWALELIAYTALGVLLFPKIPEYAGLFNTFVKLFESALGGWDLSVYYTDYRNLPTTIIYYDGSENEKIKLGTPTSAFTPSKPLPYYEYQYSGVIYHVVFLIINGLILLNLVVAIMSDTYARLMEVKNGIYFQGVIQAMPVYKSDKKYGAIISLIPPFNIFIVPLLPYYIASTTPETLKFFNRIILKIFYFPVILFISVVFTVINVALTPFAYLYALVHKIIILVRVPSCGAFAEVFFYLVFGPILHVPNIIIDIFAFVSFSYDDNLTRV